MTDHPSVQGHSRSCDPLGQPGRGQPRTHSHLTDQTAELARLTGMTGVFGKAMDFGGGEYGQTILSRHPIESHKVHALPGKGEPRIAFEANVSVDRLKLKFATK